MTDVMSTIAAHREAFGRYVSVAAAYHGTLSISPRYEALGRAWEEASCIHDAMWRDLLVVTPTTADEAAAYARELDSVVRYLEVDVEPDAYVRVAFEALLSAANALAGFQAISLKPEAQR